MTYSIKADEDKNGNIIYDKDKALTMEGICGLFIWKQSNDLR